MYTPYYNRLTYLAANLLELGNSVGERNNLRRANEGEVQWIEINHNVFSLKLKGLQFVSGHLWPAGSYL